jgi:hypothetical protein
MLETVSERTRVVSESAFTTAMIALYVFSFVCIFAVYGNYFWATWRCYKDWRTVPGNTNARLAIILTGVFAFGTMLPYVGILAGLLICGLPFLHVSNEKKYIAATGKRSTGHAHLAWTYFGLALIYLLLLALGTVTIGIPYLTAPSANGTDGPGFILCLFIFAFVGAFIGLFLWAWARLRQLPLPETLVPRHAVASYLGSSAYAPSTSRTKSFTVK